MKIKAVIHPAEEGGFWAEVPALKGCYSEGDTFEETLANIREAVQGWLHGHRTLRTGTQQGIMKDAGLTEADL